MLADMTAAEFEDWLHVYTLEPWGDGRADFRMARLAWAAVAPHTRRRIRESDFLFTFRRPSPEVAAAQYKRKAMQRYGMLAAAMNRTSRHE